jgi:hypothetical protein
MIFQDGVMISSGMPGMPQTPRKKGTRQQQTKKKT